MVKILKKTTKVFFYAATVLALVGTGEAVKNQDVINFSSNPVKIVQLASQNDFGLTQKADASIVNTQKLSKTYLVYGSGVTNKSKVKKALTDSVPNVDKIQELTINANQLYQYTGTTEIDNSNIHFAALVTPGQHNSGVKVNIVNYNDNNNINQVTAQQLALAAEIAGVRDVVINITADSETSGQNALSAVYLALQNDKLNISQKNINAANMVLASVQKVVQNNSDKTVNAELQSKLLTAVSKTVQRTIGKNASRDKVSQAFEDQLQDLNITQLSKQEQSDLINSLSVAANADNARVVKNSLKHGQKSLSSKGQTMANEDSYKSSKIADKIEGIFKSAFNFAINHFSFNDGEISFKKTANDGKQSNNVNLQTGQANSSNLLKLFSQWDGTKEGSIIEVNDGKAQFSQNELAQKFQMQNGKSTKLNPVNGLQLSNLDSLGRSQVANAYITKESMSGTEKRIPIPATSAPSGWYRDANYNSSTQQWSRGKSNNIKAKSGYVYNKSHLIGWQFFDNNKAPNNVEGVMSTNNLVTGTRVQNADPGQLRYETQIAKAVQAGHNVRLQVTPIYQGNELVPRMTHYMAESVDDNGKSININVVCLNVQPGIQVNYSTGQVKVK